MATTTSSLTDTPHRASTRDSVELTLGYVLILIVLWVPTRAQIVLGPTVLAAMLCLVLMRRPGIEELGLGVRGLIRSWWILPAAALLMIASVVTARNIGTLHALNSPDLRHVGGYVLWTIYQQFLLQDYFMPRAVRLVGSNTTAVGLTAFLFATAHLPNLVLTVATLVWGAISCALFLRYRCIYVLGIAQGLLGLCVAICVPDALHHHMRVGLGFLHYPGM